MQQEQQADKRRRVAVASNVRHQLLVLQTRICRQLSRTTPSSLTSWRVRIPSLLPRASRLPLKVVSFNMHGFHQGQSVVGELAKHSKSDLFLI